MSENTPSPSTPGTTTANIGVTMDDVLKDIDTIRDSLGATFGLLRSVSGKLKLLQKEQKASVKEVQQVRQTLKSLQAVKL